MVKVDYCPKMAQYIPFKFKAEWHKGEPQIWVRVGWKYVTIYWRRKELNE